MFRKFLFATMMFCFAGPVVAATIVFSVEETDTGVSVTGKGSFDITAASFFYPAETTTSYFGSNIIAGSGSFETYLTNISGEDFVDSSNGLFSRASSSQSGPTFGFGSFLNRIFVPKGYSGEELFGTAFYNGETLTSLKTKVGTYDYSYSGGNIQVVIASDLSPVPLPATGLLLLAGLIGLRALRRPASV